MTESRLQATAGEKLFTPLLSFIINSVEVKSMLLFVFTCVLYSVPVLGHNDKNVMF